MISLFCFSRSSSISALPSLHLQWLSMLLIADISQTNPIHAQLRTKIQVALQRRYGVLFGTGWLGFHSICVRETLCDVYILCKEYHYESILDNSFRKLTIKHYFKANRISVRRLGSFSDAVDEVLNFPN